MMNCQEAQKFIHAYLDGEFEESEGFAIAAHMQGCPGCQRQAQAQQQLQSVIKRSLKLVAAPAALRARVAVALDAVDDQRGGWSRRWLWRLIPAAAAVALVAGVVLSKEQEFTPLSSMAEQSVHWHRSHLPMDVTGSSPELVQRFFSDKVPFAVRPPSFNKQAQLVGARLSNLREHQAVYLTYKVDNKRVSVFIFDSTAMLGNSPLVHGKPSGIGTREVQWRGVKGYNVALYTSGGTGYAVTSDMDHQRMIQLIAHSR